MAVMRTSGFAPSIPGSASSVIIPRSAQYFSCSMFRLPFFLAKGFVAAESLEDALPVIDRMRRSGLHTTVDPLGEHMTQKRRALEGRDTYIRLLRALADSNGLDRNISIKLSMIGQVISEEFCLDNLRAVLEVAKETGAFVRLDMEDTSLIDSTLALFEATYPDYRDHVGVVLQAYLKRTERDVERMCELQARVRLCKGAYNEPAHLAWHHMPTIRKHFVAHMQTLLQNGRYPAIATHDDSLIEATQNFARSAGIDSDRFEFQMLFGLRPKTQLRIVEQGYNMRVYIPFGDMWLPYYSRRLRERPENILFLLRNLFRR